jgi:RHS repeat-associated protein
LTLNTYRLAVPNPAPQTPPPTARLYIDVYEKNTNNLLIRYSQNVSSEGENKWEELNVGLTANREVDIEVICENTSSTPVFFDELTVKVQSVPTVILVQENHYMPFGLGMRGLDWVAPNQREDRFQYNGKEEQSDFDLNLYDYHARQYDPQIGRMTSVDPHAENYESWTSYNYVGNNPILIIDPDGMDWVIDRKEKQGGGYHYSLTFRARLVNESGEEYSEDQMKAFVKEIKEGIGRSFNGEDGDTSWDINVDLEVGTEKNTKDYHHLIKILDSKDSRLGRDDGKAKAGERDILISNAIVNNESISNEKHPGYESGLTENKSPSLKRTTTHEIGHAAGLLHPHEHYNSPYEFRKISREAFERKGRNLMYQSKLIGKAGFSLIKEQLSIMHNLYNKGALNIK